MSESVRPEVKRYLPWPDHSEPEGWPQEYVAASDYDALQQRYDELRAIGDDLATAVAASSGGCTKGGTRPPQCVPACLDCSAMCRWRSGSAGPSGADQPDQ